eukprot:gene19469-25351_t
MSIYHQLDILLHMSIV